MIDDQPAQSPRQTEQNGIPGGFRPPINQISSSRSPKTLPNPQSNSNLMVQRAVLVAFIALIALVLFLLGMVAGHGS